jgi:quercetin dioxygenase-like cupin family protein
MAYKTAHVSEIKPAGNPDPGETEWRPVRHHFGVRAFGVNAWVAREAGDEVIEQHSESEHEELYFVASGHARFTVDGTTIDAPAGTFVHVGEPAVERSAVGEEPGTTVLAIGAAPGKAFEVSAWERRWVGDAA